MIQYINRVLSCEDDDTRIVLLYSVRSVNEIIEKESFDSWSGYWNFDVNYFITVSFKPFFYHCIFFVYIYIYIFFLFCNSVNWHFS